MQPVASLPLSVAAHSVEPIEPVQLSIVSDSQLLREGLAALLALHLKVGLVGSYTGQLPQEVALANPASHVVLLDGGVGLEGAVAWTHYWRKLNPPTRVVVLELANNHELILACIEAGASGYTLQGDSISQVAEVIKQTCCGVAQCSPEITAQLFARLTAYATTVTPPPTFNKIALTNRELEVLQCLAQDYSNQEIADKLVIGLSTVKHHVHNILEKLKLHHRWEAAHFALEQGLVKANRE